MAAAATIFSAKVLEMAGADYRRGEKRNVILSEAKDDGGKIMRHGADESTTRPYLDNGVDNLAGFKNADAAGVKPLQRFANGCDGLAVDTDDRLDLFLDLVGRPNCKKGKEN